MTPYHVTCHVTTVMCLFIVNKRKRNIKSRKIDKRKRKMLVFQHTITERVISSTSTCSLQRGLLLCIFILSWYGTEDILERIDDSLVQLLSGDADLSLGISTSMFIFMLAGIWLVERALVVVESVIFTNSLMGATIQDGGKRERSNSTECHRTLCNKLLK